MSGERILIIDDTPANLKLASFTLSAKGQFEVRTAVDVASAMETLQTFTPALILMDLQLPGVGGLELTRRLKADPATRDIIIVAVTAYAMTGDEAKARAAGCDGYITKPIDTRTLAAQVSIYLVK